MMCVVIQVQVHNVCVISLDPLCIAGDAEVVDVDNDVRVAVVAARLISNFIYLFSYFLLSLLLLLLLLLLEMFLFLKMLFLKMLSVAIIIINN